jgi:hypothetical protein
MISSPASATGSECVRCLGCSQFQDSSAIQWLAPEKPGGPKRPLCSGCTAILQEMLDAETRDPDLGRGLVGGGICAVLGVLGWFAFVVATQHELGLVAAMLGAFVGGGVAFATGDKRCPQVQGLAVGLTLAALLCAEYLIVNYFAGRALAQMGYPNLPSVLPADIVVPVAVDMLTHGKTLLIWGAACLAAFVLTKPRRLALEK